MQQFIEYKFLLLGIYIHFPFFLFFFFFLNCFDTSFSKRYSFNGLIYIRTFHSFNLAYNAIKFIFSKMYIRFPKAFTNDYFIGLINLSICIHVYTFYFFD